MLHAIFDFGAFGVVETIHGADEVSGNATDTFKLHAFANQNFLCFQCSLNRSPNTWFNNNGYIGKCGYRTLLAHQRDIHAPLQCIPVQPLQLGCPRAIRIDQGVPLSERGWKNSPVPTARNEPPARPPPPVKSLRRGKRGLGRGKPSEGFPPSNIHLNHHIGHLVLGFEAFLFRTHVADVALDLAQYFDIDAFAVVTPAAGAHVADDARSRTGDHGPRMVDGPVADAHVLHGG